MYFPQGNSVIIIQLAKFKWQPAYKNTTFHFYYSENRTQIKSIDK